MIKNYILWLAIIFTATSFGQTTYNGNTNTGFGGPIGQSSMSVDDDGTTITFTFTKGAADFNDAMVIYIDTGVSGRTTIDGDVNDQGDNLRRAVSNAGDNPTTINFPATFEATHAIAISVNVFTNFAGLWSIPNTGIIGDNGLPFVSSANLPMGTNEMTASFTFSITWANLGLANTDSFDFVATYLNSSNGFSSDEGYGGGISPGNPGAGTITFSSFETYANTLNLNAVNLENLYVITDNKSLSVKGLNAMGTLSIYNILGQSVLHEQNTFIEDNLFFDLSNTKKGIYLLRISSEGKSITKKIIIR
ncbi:T9SS type A sorting domain-containing protein [uncultured Winogradskyella sp.]|uniref:T9SS type A sorting domain-containing protein n=1 Tax=uncultured Winogradskyella sp. TaxID=395353 RepID=UPI00260501AC|nr:T9SS type A sorting domain-containing protein [uncultured Winogradskyella sp.]